jgi:chromosome segregation ATPase
MRFAVLCLASVLATQVSPVQKVIELLDELKGKVAGDLAAEETMMQEYTTWCDKEENEKEDAITSNKRTVGDLNAVITDSNARIGELSSEIEELAGKIASADADLKKAMGLRDEEHGSFAATEGELLDTVDTLSRAEAVLGRGQFSFLQQHGEKLSALTAGLEKIIEATWVNSKQKAVVQSLLQSASAASEDDEDLSLQPQATAASYSSQGGGILDTLKDMKEKAEGTLSDARGEEMKSAHAYAMLKQSLEQELKTMNKRMAAATAEKAGTEKALADASEQLTATEKTLAADTKYLENLRQSCSAKAAEWAQRQKDAAEEMGAIAKAKEILSEGVKSFLQVTSKTTDDSSPTRDQVTAILEKLSRKSHSFSLSQLVSSARSDTFGKVKGLIEGMIDRLEKEAAEEADAKAFCDTETEKSRAKQADLSAKLDMHTVRIEKATANIDELKVQIKGLQEAMAAMDASEAEATSLRQKEHAEYLKASAEYKQSADAVANAVQVLQTYYSQGSFVQAKQAPELGSAQGDIATQILGMLEVAESDFTRLLAESEADEKSSQSAYDKLKQENAVARAANIEEVKGKESEVKRVDMSLLNYKEDHASTSKELDAVLKYLDELKPQCESKVMSYAERKAAREDEINGLKEALEILGA